VNAEQGGRPMVAPTGNVERQTPLPSA